MQGPEASRATSAGERVASATATKPTEDARAIEVEGKKPQSSFEVTVITDQCRQQGPEEAESAHLFRIHPFFPLTSSRPPYRIFRLQQVRRSDHQRSG